MSDRLSKTTYPTDLTELSSAGRLIRNSIDDLDIASSKDSQIISKDRPANVPQLDANQAVHARYALHAR